MTHTAPHLPAVRPFVVAPEDGERIWFLQSTMTIKASAATTGGELSLLESLIAPGFGPPLHVHHDDHEAFYVLAGALDIVCGGERYQAGAGAFAFLPRGTSHAFRATSDQPVRLLTIGVPGGVEGLFRDGGRPAEHPGLPPRAALDISALKRVALRHNNEIVGPPLG